MTVALRVALITVSDSVAEGTREDRGGPACEQALKDAGLEPEIASREVLPDDRHQIARAIRGIVDSHKADLVVEAIAVDADAPKELPKQ